MHGLVHREIEFSIQELKEKFPTYTLPITLVCAGNRRKEQNMVAKGLGFNWGAAGVSTGLFTGVYLADILEYCKPKNPLLSSFPAYDVVVPDAQGTWCLKVPTCCPRASMALLNASTGSRS